MSLFSIFIEHGYHEDVSDFSSCYQKVWKIKG
eukprot:UN12731